MSVPQGQNQVTPPFNLPHPALLRFNQAILVSRHDPASRRRVVEEVRRRATSRGRWPQVGRDISKLCLMCRMVALSFPLHSVLWVFLFFVFVLFFTQVLFFPEGTCSNKKALLKFKPGAFIAGVPVQPVLIRYPNSLVSLGGRKGWKRGA